MAHEVILLQLNKPTASGRIYTTRDVEEYLAKFPDFELGLQVGTMRGQYGSPRPYPGESTADFINRCQYVEETFLCLKVRSAEFKDGDWWGTIETTGPYGLTAEKYLSESEQPVVLAMRALTHLRTDGTHEIQQILAFDLVNQSTPG